MDATFPSESSSDVYAILTTNKHYLPCVPFDYLLADTRLKGVYLEGY